MNRTKIIVGWLFALFSIFVTFAVTSVILVFANVVQDKLFYVIATTVLLIIGGIIMFLAALYLNERRQIKEIIKENDYNLHRKTTFYSYNFFTHVLSGIRIKNRKGYMVAFNAVKSSGSTTYAMKKAADFNGFLSDYIVETFLGSSQKKAAIRDAYYCFYRGNFIFYLICNWLFFFFIFITIYFLHNNFY